MRSVRILGIALTLAIAFRISRDVSAAWGNPDVPGYTAALGVVAFLFVVRAAVTEQSRPDLPDTQKDILWGISLGAFVTLLTRLLR